MWLSRLAFRNLLRQRRRSILTGLTMAGGYLLFAVSLGMSNGTYANIIDLFTRARVGHVQVHAKGYLDEPSLYNTMSGVERVGRTIESMEEVRSWAPRVYAPGLAFADKKTSGVEIVGIDPQREARTTTIAQQVTAGRFLSDRPGHEALLSRGLAEALDASVGDEVALIAQAADGSLANDLFTVAGLIGEEGGVFERKVYLDLTTAQAALALDGRVHEIAIVLNRLQDARAAAAKLASALDDPSLDVEPWQVVEREFYVAMQADRKGMWISLGIIVFIVAIGVLNTVLMAVLERTREFAVLRALGTRPVTVLGMIVLETAYMAGLSVLLGAVLSLGANGYLVHHGLPLPEPITYGGVRWTVLLGSLTPSTFWVPAVVTIGTAVFVSVFPALRAARIDPAHGMRMY